MSKTGSERLKSFVERIAELHEERRAITADITEVVSEAKGVGYIPKTLRKVVARYMADPAKLAEEDDLLETYEAALGHVGRALAAVHAGATWDEASKEHDVPRATLARAAAVSKQREVIPESEPRCVEPSPDVAANGGEGRCGPDSKPAAVAQGAVFGDQYPSGVHSTPPQPDNNTAERPALQEVGASDPRPEGTPIPDDLTIPAHLDQRKRQVHA